MLVVVKAVVEPMMVIVPVAAVVHPAAVTDIVFVPIGKPLTVNGLPDHVCAVPPFIVYVPDVDDGAGLPKVMLADPVPLGQTGFEILLAVAVVAQLGERLNTGAYTFNKREVGYPAAAVVTAGLPQVVANANVLK